MAEQARARTRRDMVNDLNQTTTAVVQSSARTLSQYGMNPDEFAMVVCEALLSNPEIMECTEASVAKALRMACQDGLVPNGREAAIVIFKDHKTGDKNATYLPMKEGMARLWYENVGCPLLTGLVREGDEVDTVIGAGVYQKIEIKRDPFREKEGTIKGCYLWTHIPGEDFPRLVIWRKEDIDKRRAVSRSGEKGPWSTWYGEKAQTSIQKHFLNSLRHQVTSARRGQQLLNIIDADTQRELGEGEQPTPARALPAHEERPAVETTATVVEPTQEEQPRPAQPPAATQEDDIPEDNVSAPATAATPASNGETQGTFLPKEPPAATSPTDL